MRRLSARCAALFFALAIVALISAVPHQATAQYIYLDSNGDGIHTSADVLATTGTTTVDVWLSTDHNRDGGEATCDTGDGPLSINSYSFILKAQHGTVTWSGFTNQMAGFDIAFGVASNATDYVNGFGSGAYLQAGLYHLATLSITPATGTPLIIVASNSTLNNSYTTSFGSQCSGNDLDNTLKLGSDWVDADGLAYGGAVGSPPVLAQPGNMTVAEGATADQTLTATDVDLNPLTFSKTQGPNYVTVTTSDPGTGTGMGNVHLAPDYLSAGTSLVEVQVSDGFNTDEKQFQVTVTNVPRPIDLAPIPNLEVQLSHVAYYYLSVSDPEGRPFSVQKTTGPDYMQVISYAGLSGGYIYLAPTLGSQIGTAHASVTASDGLTSDTESFDITVTSTRRPTLSVYAPPTAIVNSLTYINVYVTDYDNVGITSLTADVSGLPAGDETNFTTYSGYRYGYLYWTPHTLGTYTIRFSFTDATGYSATDSATVSVVPAPPRVVTPNQIVSHFAEPIDFTVTASDPDHAIVSLTADFSDLPPVNDATFVPNGDNTEGHFHWTPHAEDLQGQLSWGYSVSFQASNGSGIGYGYVGIILLQLDLDHLDANRLDLLVSNGGVIGRDLRTGNAGLFYPKGSTHTVLFSSGPWLGGFEDDTLHYARGGNSPEFGIGTMTNGTFSPLQDRFRNYKLVRGDVTSPDYLNWPVGDGAPVDAGGAPDLKGDQLIWNVYNDANPDYHPFYSEYGNEKSKPVGVEIQQSVFSYNLPGALGDIAFVRMKMINKSSKALENAYAGIYADADVGGFSDDIVGCDPALGLGYVYNATNNDAQYGAAVPALGWVLLQGPELPGGSRLGLTSVQTYIGSDISQRPAVGSYYLQLGRNVDGSPMHVRDDPSAPVTTFRYDGDPVMGTGWLDTHPGDKRLLMSSGPFPMAPGAEQDIYAAILVGAGANRLASVAALRPLARVAKYLHRSGYVPLPYADAPESVTVYEGSQLTFTFSAFDLDGDPLTALTADLDGLPLGNGAIFQASGNFSSGTFTWTPTFNDAGLYVVTFRAANAQTGLPVATKIRVIPTNRPPVASPGGTYSGVAGVPVAFDGTGSSDPDGDALTLTWDFGDGSSGSGAKIAHVYGAGGAYVVTLTASDGSLAGVAVTQASILDALAARAYAPAGQATIRLGTQKPFHCLEIEPIGGDFSIDEVDLSSIRMHSSGTGSVDVISSIAGKTATVSDRDQNGVLEIEACFAKADLRKLFDGLTAGSHDVTVSIEGHVASGARFTSTLTLKVIVAGALTASISPNPMNPEATLTFRTTTAGPVRVTLYDINGRLVRSLIEASLAPGYHDVRIDGSDQNGGRLASGLYFVSIEAPEGQTRGKVTVLR